MRGLWFLLALPLLVVPLSVASTPPSRDGIMVAPLPAPPRELIMTPDPAAPRRSFADVIGDVLRQAR